MASSICSVPDRQVVGIIAVRGVLLLLLLLAVAHNNEKSESDDGVSSAGNAN